MIAKTKSTKNGEENQIIENDHEEERIEIENEAN